MALKVLLISGCWGSPRWPRSRTVRWTAILENQILDCQELWNFRSPCCVVSHPNNSESPLILDLLLPNAACLPVWWYFSCWSIISSTQIWSTKFYVRMPFFQLWVRKSWSTSSNVQCFAWEWEMKLSSHCNKHTDVISYHHTYNSRARPLSESDPAPMFGLNSIVPIWRYASHRRTLPQQPFWFYGRS